MGVMSCHRPDCERVMCHAYIEDIGYVCHDCQEEFKDYIQSQAVEPQTENEIKRHLAKFMKSDKGTYLKDTSSKMSIDEFFLKGMD